MQRIINGETSFKAITTQFMVGPSESGYVLGYSADNETFTECDKEVPAGENLQVNGAQKFGWYKLIGNTGDVVVVL